MPLTSGDWKKRWQTVQVKYDTPQLEVLKQDTVSISTINAGTGSKELGITVFEFAILCILEFYGVSWSDFQIRDAAEMLYSDCYWFSMSELKHFTIRVKKADFGKISEDYSKFAPKHLMQCSTIYCQEALYARGQYNFPKQSPVQEVPEENLIDVTGKLKEWAEALEADVRSQKAEAEAEYQRLKEKLRKERENDLSQDQTEAA